MSVPMAKNYAKAIFDIALAKGTAEEVWEDFHHATDIFFNELSLDFFRSYVVKKAVKHRVLDDALNGSIDEDLLTMMHILIEKGRFDFLEKIETAYTDVFFSHYHITRVTVRTALPLAEKDQHKIEFMLARKFLRQIVLEIDLDPAIIGGIVFIVGSVEYDYSIRGHLRDVYDRMTRAPLQPEKYYED